MTENQPKYDSTKARQGNSKKTNSRALVFGMIGAIVVLAIVLAWTVFTQPDETPTTLDDVPAAAGSTEAPLEDLSTPAPVQDAPTSVTEIDAATPATTDTESSPMESPAPAGN